VKRENFGGAMIWTLDMDDFNGEFCRKNKRQSKTPFPLVNAMKEEFLIDELTTPISTLSIQSTTTLSNETILLSEEFQNALNQMFLNASVSSEFSPTYFFLFCLLTTCYLIRSTIYIIS
jgi:hypothetical protein